MRLHGGLQTFAGALFATAGLATLPSTAWSAVSCSEVPAPCSDNNPNFRSCSDVLTNPTAGTNGPVGIIPNVQARAQTQIAEYYQGVDFDPTLAANATQAPFPQPICNLQTEGPTQNHLSSTCGKPVQINVALSIQRGWFGIPTGATATPTLDLGPADNTDSPNDPGSLERGYIRGALMAAINYYESQVTQEINQKHQLTVGPIEAANGSGTITESSSCQAIASDLSTLISSFESAGNVAQLSGWNCTTGAPTNAQASQTAAPQVAVHQLCASRAAIETMYGQLAACEVFNRALMDWTYEVGSKSAMSAFIQKVENQTEAPMKACLSSRGGGCRNSACATSVANSCYQSVVLPVLREQLKALWSTSPAPLPAGCSS